MYNIVTVYRNMTVWQIQCHSSSVDCIKHMFGLSKKE